MASSSPNRPRQARRRRISKASRAQAIFGILAILVVCSLVAGTLGAAVIDAIRNRGDDTPSVSNPTSEDDPTLAEMQTAVAANPNDAAPLAALGNYLANTGRTSESVQWYEKALALEPENSTIRLDFARSLAEGEKRADAELQFQKVIAADPKNAQAHYSLAGLYANWIPPRTADEIAEYQTVIAVGGDSYVVGQAEQALAGLGVATPAAGTPAASPIAREGAST